MKNIDHDATRYATCQLLGESLQLPVHYITVDGSKQESFAAISERINPLFPTTLEQIHSMLRQVLELEHGVKSELPVLLTSPYMERFMVVPIIAALEADQDHESSDNKRSSAYVVIGPCSSEKFSDEIIAKLMNDNQVSYKAAIQWQLYLHALPHVPVTRLLHIGVLAHQLLNDIQLHIIDVLHGYVRYSSKQQLEENVDIAVANQRESALFHMQLDEEKQFFELIRLGKKDELLKGMLDLPYEEVGILSKRSQLRNRKNLGIISIAFATRAAIEGGLYKELAFTLSDLHIQHIEELNEVKSVEAATIAALLDFTERVNQGSKQNISKPVLQCQEYIYNHLYEPISPSSLAELAGLNASYLSQLFKKETGMALSSYIQHEKIEEAKRLLLHSQDKISSISMKLSFYDETYFVKVFKKHTGMTPRAYRTSSGRTLLRL